MEITKITVDPKEMAEMLGINVSTAYELTRRKGFPAIRISERRIIIPVDALKKWLTEEAFKNKNSNGGVI
jgi:excisionase family DNA binding protein